MKNDELNILFVADIVGKPGLDITARLLEPIKKKYGIDVCIANGENGASGKGLTDRIALQYFSLGIDVITTGNHVWDNFAFHKYLDSNPRVLRPLNYPAGNNGKGTYIWNTRDKLKVAVVNLQGRTFMYPIDCPFRSVLSELKRLQEQTPVIIVDFHAEATAEKMAMAWFLDGKVSALIGTHTHVQTADERILPKGTAFISDVGMTGPFDSVIGLDKEVAITRFLRQIPVKYKIADGNVRFCAAVVSVNSVTGKAKSIRRLMLPES